MKHKREKQSVLRAKRFRRALIVRCVRSIFCIDNFTIECCAGGRCRR